MLILIKLCQQIGKSILTSTNMVNDGFENVFITSMNRWIDEEDENQSKLEVILYAQFTEPISNNTYSEYWEALLETDNYLKNNVAAGSKVAAPLKCPNLKVK